MKDILSMNFIIINFSIRHKWKTNKEAAKDLMKIFPEHIVGMVLYQIMKHHFEQNIHYTLSSDAEEMFEEIIDNYNAQFNLKYSSKHLVHNFQVHSLNLKQVRGKRSLCVQRQQS